MDSESIYFRPIVEEDTSALRQLHDECLPFAYRESFYDELFQRPDHHFALLAALKPRQLTPREGNHSQFAESDDDDSATQQNPQRASPNDEKIVAAVTCCYSANLSAANATGVPGETFPRRQDLGGAVVVGGTILVYIRSLVVAPQHRRQGLATHLLDRCVQDARRRYVVAVVAAAVLWRSAYFVPG